MNYNTISIRNEIFLKIKELQRKLEQESNKDVSMSEVMEYLFTKGGLK